MLLGGGGPAGGEVLESGSRKSKKRGKQLTTATFLNGPKKDQEGLMDAREGKVRSLPEPQRVKGECREGEKRGDSGFPSSCCRQLPLLWALKGGVAWVRS